MAKKKNWKKKGKYSDLEKFAYKMGQVNRGLGNKNSLVYESFQNGNTVKEKKSKKPLL